MSQSILQPWVTELGLRHQGVLLTAVRGCDTWSKHSEEKPLVREMRGLILVPFDARELRHVGGFMIEFGWLNHADVGFKALLDNIDGLPVHYVMHVLHSVEIIAYCHPKPHVRNAYLARYLHLCAKFHLNPESPEEMAARLTEDRIAKGTVEQ